MTALAHHFRTRLTALLGSPVQMVLGTVVLYIWVQSFLDPFEFMLGAAVEQYGWPSWDVVQFGLAALGSHWCLLCLLIWTTAPRGRGAAAVADQRRLDVAPHSTLPVSSRARAVAESLVWLPVWYLAAPLLVGVLATIESALRIGSLWAALPTWDYLSALWSEAESSWYVRSILTVPLFALPPLIVSLRGRGSRLADAIFRPSPWMIAGIIVLMFWPRERPLDRALLGVSLCLLALLPARMGMRPWAWWDRLGHVDIAWGTARLRPFVPARRRLIGDAIRGSVAQTPLLLTGAAILTTLVLCGYSLSGLSLTEPLRVCGYATAFALLGGIAVWPFGMSSGGCRGDGRLPVFDGTLAQTWGTLPVPPDRIVQWHYALTLAGMTCMVTLLAYVLQPLPEEALDALMTFGLYALLIGGLLAALAIGTEPQRGLATALTTIAIGWIPCYDILSQLVEVRGGAPLPDPPSWLQFVVMAVAAGWTGAALLWPRYALDPVRAGSVGGTIGRMRSAVWRRRVAYPGAIVLVVWYVAGVVHDPKLAVSRAGGWRARGDRAIGQWKDPAFVQHHLARGAEVNEWGLDGWSHLHSAVAAGNPEVVRLLLGNGADITRFGPTSGYETPVHLAARLGNVAVLDVLLETGGDEIVRASSGYTPLHEAVVWGHFDIAQRLIDMGANVNAADEGGTPLHYAVRRDRLRMVRMLVEHGGEVNAATHRGVTPLHVALGEYPTQWPSLLMYYAERYRSLDGISLEQVQYLIDRGADVNARDDAGRTPLIYALDGEGANKMLVVRALLAGGAKPNVGTTESGMSPLDLAVEWDEAEIARLLLKSGADPNALDKHGRTLLFPEHI